MTGGFGLWKGGGGIYWCKLELVGDGGIIHSYPQELMTEDISIIYSKFRG